MLLCSWLLAGSGCWVSSKEGDEMREAARARDQRLEQLEARERADRDELAAKVARLEQVLDSATQLLTRGSADAVVALDQIREQVATQEGRNAELLHQIETVSADLAALRAELDKRAPTVAPEQQLKVPETAAAHFDAAYQAYGAGNYTEARSLFREYLKRYPQDPKAGNAQYWVGASYHQEGKPATALGEYRKVITHYTESTAVNVALFGMADAFFRLHACSDAKSALETLLRRDPDAALADRTKKLLREIKKAPASECSG
jgi:tol-pal system protein YbgF